MDLTALIQNPIVGRVAEMAIAALWQGALIAGALAIFMRLSPRVAAAYRFAAWSAAFVVLVGLSLFSLAPHISFGIAHSALHVPQNVAGPMFDLDARWSLGIVALWMIVAVLRAADLAIHSLRLRRLWKEAIPVTIDERVASVLDAALADCARGPVEVCTTKTLQRPSVIGFFRPRILIPDWLYARLTRGELEQIVLHEAEHLRRRDDWTNLAQKLCLVVFPLNPALAWIERKLCSEREMACDEGVIRVTRAPRAYAACLASLAERGLERRVEALSLGAWQRRPELVHRVHSILRSKSGLSPVSARVLLGTLGCGLIAGSVELAQSPQLVAFVPESRSLAVAAHDSSATAGVNALPLAVQERAVVQKRKSARGNDQTIAVNASLRQPEVPATPAVKDPRTTSEVKAVPVTVKSQPNETGVPQEQQWVVMTTWTQVYSTGAKASGGVRSDYDVDAAGYVDADAQSDQQPANRITVTQLIFRLQPAAGQTADAGQPGNAASNSTTSKAGTSKKSNHAASPAPNPSTIQPKIAAIRDGWLVLQL
jgi:beta-lactamase regulating signal transducer with metallopeptidase domain